MHLRIFVSTRINMKKLILMLGLIAPWMAFADYVHYTIRHVGSFDYWDGEDGSHLTGQWLGNIYDLTGYDANGNRLTGEGMMVFGHLDVHIKCAD